MSNLALLACAVRSFATKTSPLPPETINLIRDMARMRAGSMVDLLSSLLG